MKQNNKYGIGLGDTIRIVHMDSPFVPENYKGKEGKVTLIDPEGKLRGTWGGFVVTPGVDTIVVVQRVLDPSLPEELIGGGPSPARQRRSADSSVQMMID